MSAHLRGSLRLLSRLNAARAQHDRAAAKSAEIELERHDMSSGYLRPIRVESIPQTGQYATGRQRNPNWRAALDKLNRMRGRVA